MISLAEEIVSRIKQRRDDRVNNKIWANKWFGELLSELQQIKFKNLNLDYRDGGIIKRILLAPVIDIEYNTKTGDICLHNNSRRIPATEKDNSAFVSTLIEAIVEAE